MAKPSNTIVAILTLLFLLGGLALVVGGLYFHVSSATACQKSLQIPLLVLGVVIFAVSLLGFVGSCCRYNNFLKLYLFLMFLLIVGLIGFTIFSFVITNADAGAVVSGKGFKEYKLGDYSHWLRNHLVNGKNWDVIKSCLVDVKVCKSLSHHQKMNGDFLNINLSAIQSGCCKPPTECGFEHKNATYWTVPESGRPASTNGDCTTWSNNERGLCYNCNSCKAGFLANIRKQWRTLLIFLVCITVLTIVVFFVGVCATRNNKFYRRYPQRYYNRYP